MKFSEKVICGIRIGVAGIAIIVAGPLLFVQVNATLTTVWDYAARAKPTPLILQEPFFLMCLV